MVAAETTEGTAAREQMSPGGCPLPGNPEDALIDQAGRDLRLLAFGERFVELAATSRREPITYKQFLLDRPPVEVDDRDVLEQTPVRTERFPRPKQPAVATNSPSPGIRRDLRLSAATLTGSHSRPAR